MKKDFVSIIIVNYNGKELLKTILESIEKSSFKNYETIIVDNKSSDGSREFIKKNYKKIKLVSNKKNLGYSGINSALKFCKGSYLLFLNNDMELDKDCIKNLVRTINSDKDIAMAAPKLVNFYNKNLKSNGTWVSRAFYNGHIKGDGKEAKKEIPYLGVGLIKKDFVDKFGYLFDPDYFIYAEDLDLGLRIRLSGKKIIFEPKAAIWHMHNVTMQKKDKAFSTFLMERNLLTTFFKILSLKSILIYMPYVFGLRLIAVLKDLITLRLTNGCARIAAILWIFANFKKIGKKRESSQKARKMNDHFVFQVFSEKELFKFKHFTV